MAIKTFNVGEVLTATDTNTYLANSGLVFVKSQAVATGAGVSSVTVSNAFSADYLNYKIIYYGGYASGNGDIYLQLGTANTNYAYQFIYGSYTNGVTGSGNSSATNFPVVGGASSTIATLNCELIQPFTASFTTCTSVMTSATGAGTFTGQHRAATSFSSFTIGSGVNLIGGTIVVYGYRLP